MEDKEIKYEIPRLEIASLIDKSITLKLKKKRLIKNIKHLPLTKFRKLLLT